MLKPPKLQAGSKVAIVSPSWGGPSRFPDIYELGLSVPAEAGAGHNWIPVKLHPPETTADRVPKFHKARSEKKDGLP